MTSARSWYSPLGSADPDGVIISAEMIVVTINPLFFHGYVHKHGAFNQVVNLLLDVVYAVMRPTRSLLWIMSD